MKNSSLKKFSGTVIAGIMIAASVNSAFAGTTVTRISTVDVNNSCINTIVSQNDSTIKAVGKDVDIVDITDKTIRDSIINTGVFESSSTINAKGKNIKITSADSFAVDGSVTDALVNDVKSKIRTITRWFEYLLFQKFGRANSFAE